MRKLGVTFVVLLALASNAGLASGPRPAPGGSAAKGPREFTVIAERFKFTPERIQVTQGETVRLTVRSADGTHGFEIKKLKVDELVPKGGEPVTVEFVADRPGSFEISCSEYCGRGHSRMKAILEVAPAADGGTR